MKNNKNLKVSIVMGSQSDNKTMQIAAKILKKMNADITIKDVEIKNNENIGTIVVKKSRLQGVIVEAKDVADMVDEFPVFTLLASQAAGNTVVEGAQELRLKESDRIMAMENFIINLGGQINTNSNG